MEKRRNWRLQSSAYNQNIHQAMQQQHHAAQFIAMAGKYLIPQQPDDSNTNMEFIATGNLLSGREIPPGLHIALQLEDLKIILLNKNNEVQKTIDPEGKTKQQVFNELKQSLSQSGVDVSSLKQELHYEIQAHPLDKGDVFSVKDKTGFIENANYRSNANLVLNEIATGFEEKEPIRVWPHHFDTGAFYVISKNEKGETSQTIGIGFAMPDSMVNEPYYYLSFWSEKTNENLKELPPLDAGKWMMPDWDGAVLKHSDIIKTESASGQHELVKSFFNAGIKMIMDRL